MPDRILYQFPAAVRSWIIIAGLHGHSIRLTCGQKPLRGTGKEMSGSLKILALDADDLKVISAHVQDAVVKAAEIEHLASAATLVLPVNRFAWEQKPERRLFSKVFQRRRSILQFGKVQNVRSKGVNRNQADQILSVLALTFTGKDGDDDPSGTLDITFAGDAALQLDVECIEAKLTDLGAAWQASGIPRHPA